MTTDSKPTGLAFCVERTHPFHRAMGVSYACLRCGERFEPDTVTIWLKADDEYIGSFGPCCLAPCARARLEEECRKFDDEP